MNAQLRLPTLGYMPDTTITPTNIALMQLNDAIVMFTHQRFISALTLAGAAEEILGKLVAKRGEEAVIKESITKIERLTQQFKSSTTPLSTAKELTDHWNRARNAAKHLTPAASEGASIEMNPCDEAYWMIRRAMENAEKLSQTVDLAQDFENWVIANVNM